MKYELIYNGKHFPLENESNKDRYVDFYYELQLRYEQGKQYNGNFVADFFVPMWYYQELNDDGTLRDGGFKFNSANQKTLDAIGRLPAGDKIVLNKID